MEKLIMLGTGHAMTLDCYNTCFILQNNQGEGILVDTGGGLQIIKQLRDANIDFRKIHNIILSHKHTDHILGIFWIIRYIQKFIANNTYEGNLNIYMHSELEKTVRKIVFEVLPEKFTSLIDNRIIFADIFKPYEKMHSTVKTASQIAQSLNVENLLLYHGSDNNIENRKKSYISEAKEYFTGNIFVPDDLDIIEL